MARATWRVVLLLMLVVGCQQKQCRSRVGTSQDRLVVYAAASLREAFSRLSQDFRSTRPGVTVTFNFAGSQELRTQIEHGAPADVFASADERNMDLLERAKLVEGPVLFAQNELVIVVAPEKSSTICSLARLPLAQRLVFGARDVPIGMYTQQVIERAAHRWGADFAEKVRARIVSHELNVRQVLAKVVLGEADAGIVYRTDVIGNRGAFSVIEIEAEFNVVAGYPIALLKDATHPKLAHEWIEFVLSEHGQQLLEASGFRLPSHQEVH